MAKTGRGISNNLGRIVQGQAGAAQVVQDTQRAVSRLLPRAS